MTLQVLKVTKLKIFLGEKGKRNNDFQLRMKLKASTVFQRKTKSHWIFIIHLNEIVNRKNTTFNRKKD